MVSEFKQKPISFSKAVFQSIFQHSISFGADENFPDSPLFDLEPVDRVCYKASVKELQKRMESEEGLADIMDTTGYFVVDHDAIRPIEYEEAEKPYSGTGLFPGNFRGYGNYQSLTLLHERRSIAELAQEVKKQNPSVVVEIGAGLGGSFYLWCRYLDSATQLISVDNGYIGRQPELFRTFTSDASVRCIEGNSHNPEVYERVREELDESSIDFLYIDGDHRYQGVKQDFETYGGLVDQGIIGLDDVSHPGTEVPEYWGELKETETTEEVGSSMFKNGIVKK